MKHVGYQAGEYPAHYPAPAVLDQGLIRDVHDDAQTERDHTAMFVRQVRGLLEQRSMPCGYPGCSYCDPDYDPSWDYGD